MSDHIRNKSRSGQARIEYRAVQKEVEEMLTAGYSQIMIHEDLTAKNKLTVSYSAFCDYVRGQGKRQHQGAKKSAPLAARATGSKYFKPGLKSEPFFVDRSLTLEDLVGKPKNG